MARAARIAVALAALALLAGVAVARQGTVVATDVVPEGFASYRVDRVRVSGAEFYVDRSTDLEDIGTALLLGGVALLLAGAAARLRPDPRAPVFATAAAGSAFLAADEVLAAHETLGHNLPVLGRLPVIDHPDDAIVALYGVAMLAFLWRHRGLAGGTSPVPWVIAVLAGGLAVAHDVLPVHYRRVEEGLEVVAGLALVAGVALVVRRNAAR